MGHDFSAVRKKDGTFIDFLGGEHNTGKNYFVDIPPKIYRYTFGVQVNHPFFEVNEIIAPKLYNPIYTDVTPEYLDSKKVVVPKSKLYNVKNKLIYLCAFDNNKWVPIDIGKENGENIVFENVGRDIIYLPAQYIENEVFPIGPAILVDDEVSFIYPSESDFQELTLKRKYPINYLKRMWMSWMIGGTFEGSNNERFSNAHALFTIKDTVEMVTHSKEVKSKSKYRYLRYLFPDNSFGSLGEITFLDCKGDTLEGKMIKSEKVKETDWQIAFDLKLDQFIHTPERPDYNGEWIGIKLKEPSRVCEIQYTPRTDRNNLEEGDLYNLQYWDNIWVSIEIKKALKNNEIAFQNVPKGALLRLSNLTKGKEERIFLYDGKVKWY